MEPRAEYIARRNRWERERAASDEQFIRIGNARLVVALAAVVLGWLVLWRGAVSGWWLLLPFALFVALVVWHSRVARRQELAKRAIHYYARGLARLEDRWAGTGNAGERFCDGSHVYADDLDVFGKGSLFELISSARTEVGERTLAGWLRTPATRELALARQEAVRELRDRLDLREDIALLGEDVRAGVHAEALAKWGAAPPVAFAPWLRALAVVLTIAGVATGIAFLADAIKMWPFLLVFAADVTFIAALRHRVRAVVSAAETPGEELKMVALLLERLEREQFQSARLQALRAALDVKGTAASREIARLERWVMWLDASDHLFVRAIRPVVLWYEQLAMGIEAWRRESGPSIAQWLEAVGEFEALSSLASLAFERPEWSFPVLLDGGARFAAERLQHPLMSPAHCVPNDVEIGGAVRVLIVSGSNMSGKSTLLRAMGLNTVLAWAGAPVAARTMEISGLHAGASIRVTDSLLDNRSRFYAEITRLRQIMDAAAGGRPVLFLLDELLSGTNSHDRRIGAAAVVKGLAERGAIGLITTHDLALAELAADGRAANVHFEDQMIDGRMEFDYRLRPGVVTHSNALELMRAVGLPV